MEENQQFLALEDNEEQEFRGLCSFVVPLYHYSSRTATEIQTSNLRSVNPTPLLHTVSDYGIADRNLPRTVSIHRAHKHNTTRRAGFHIEAGTKSVRMWQETDLEHCRHSVPAPRRLTRQPYRHNQAMAGFPSYGEGAHCCETSAQAGLETHGGRSLASTVDFTRVQAWVGLRCG